MFKSFCKKLTTNMCGESDKWTNLTAVGHVFSGFINDSYWLANMFDVATGFEPTPFGLSLWGIAVGGSIALLSAFGSTYCDRVVNTTHQREINTDVENQVPTYESTSSVTTEDTNIQLIDSNVKASLRWYQLLALVGEGIAHTGDFAGTITFFINTIDHGLNHKISRGAKIGLHAGTMFIGAITSVSEVRSSRNAIVDSNKDNEQRFSK